MLSPIFIFLATSTLLVDALASKYPLPVHNITRLPPNKFENLAIRSNGQILATTAAPNASIYQIDPLSILPPTLLYTIPLTNGSAAGIAEGPERDVFYVVAGRYDILDTAVAYPKTYQIVEVDVRGMFVWPNGTMNRQPGTKRVANLTGAQLPNGAAFARPSASKNLMVADSYRGVIWNVDVHSGQVKVALNDASTRGGASQGPAFTGINGIKEFNGSLYWSNTGRKELWKVQVDEHGDVPKAAAPTMIMSNITCDDLIVDKNGVVYVAGPEDVITMVTPDGKQTVVAGTYGSLNSSLVGPTALRFGRGVSDQWSLYVTTNGGLPQLLGGSEPSAAGVSRIDLDP